MARNVTMDTLEIRGANLWVDLGTGEIRLEMNYVVRASADDVSVVKQADASPILTSDERTAILGMTARLKGVLEQQELA
ncbi:MAG: hypothetical protein Q8O40_07080 [Chloroflexota bacterium]|nr:hypothetical protein [Chloroflexota bacterium]